MRSNYFYTLQQLSMSLTFPVPLFGIKVMLMFVLQTKFCLLFCSFCLINEFKTLYLVSSFSVPATASSAACCRQTVCVCQEEEEAFRSG